MFEMQNGNARFIDTSDISHEQFVKILHKFQYIGYSDFTEPDEIKAYFDRHMPLNSDQTEIILQVLKNKKPEALYPEDQMLSDIKTAVKTFGITSIFSRAGYLLPDGSLLDFSENQNHRTLDHRAINDVMEFDNASAAMVQFMTYGCVRITENSIDLIQPLTDQQKQTIRQQIRYLSRYSNNSFYVDITNPNGYTVWSNAYHDLISVSIADKLFNDIEKYFQLFIS